MTPSIESRRERLAGDGGFTLIEVMVVVLVIGILLAIGIPTYLGARSRAQDKGAQSTLRASQTTALVIFTDSGDFSGTSTAALAASEPAYTWSDGTTASADDQAVSATASGDNSEWGAAAMSDSGTCFYIRLSSAGATRYGSSSSAACTGAQALTVTDAGW